MNPVQKKKMHFTNKMKFNSFFGTPQLLHVVKQSNKSLSFVILLFEWQ